jgi:hypothetical protein
MVQTPSKSGCAVWDARPSQMPCKAMYSEPTNKCEPPPPQNTHYYCVKLCIVHTPNHTRTTRPPLLAADPLASPLLYLVQHKSCCQDLELAALTSCISTHMTHMHKDECSILPVLCTCTHTRQYTQLCPCGQTHGTQA